MRFESGRSWRVLGGLLLAALVGAAPASAGSPVGPQKVLVVLMDLGSTTAELCGNANPCPVNDASFYQPPRHSGQDWDNLLNNYGTRYWQLASYGQTQAVFSVLPSPFSQNGWWKPPHTAADYYVNGDLWNDSKTHAFVEDAARGALQTWCTLSFQLCSVFNQFDRFILMSNKKARGGVTNGNNVPMTVHTSFGNFDFTATFVDESTNDDDALSVAMHEFGHQLGIPTHYGDCGPSYIPVVQGSLECVGAWDVMAYDWAWSQPTGYSRISRGWINPNSTLSYDLLSGVPFSTLTFIRPVSLAPNNVPNLIRLSIGGLNWPQFYGYFAECRKRINGDEGLYPGSSGIYREGLLITSVHEFSAPPVHVVRPIFPPAADPSVSILQPGDSYSDPQLGLFIRLNGYAGDDADPLCDVEVDYLTPPRIGPILLWQNRVTPGPEPSFRSFDIGMNHPLPPGDPSGGGVNQPLKVEPLWPGHSNALLLRAHTTGTLPAENVRLNVSFSQPALFTSTCGTFTNPFTREVPLPPIDPIGGGSASVAFKPGFGSLGIEMYAPADPGTGAAASNVVASRGAFQFFRSGSLLPQRTLLKLQANQGCPETTTFHIAPVAVPPGWQATVSPEVVGLAPGARAFVVVTVTPPAGAQPGENAEIGIDVSQVENTDRPVPPPQPGQPDLPLDQVLMQHVDHVGSMQISARVVGAAGTLNLSCAGGGPAGGPVLVSGSIAPVTPNSTAMLEYMSPSGTQTHFVTTDAAGTFTDSLVPGGDGHGSVQAFWPGDTTHAPAQSSRCSF